MPFQALLFCPDDKTARTLTQVLGELEFNVEPCAEPFGAVKKLMSQHFDALVVDCDNEQNAALLFKSARNSTSNQASLAVAIVEGQAGVAKAFRIGANLVLTKPINVEQSKGTLRVARGLLRKGDPGKPATPASPASPAPAAAAPATQPAKPAAAKPAPPKTLPPRPSTKVAPPSASRPVARPLVPAAKSPADVAAVMAAESSGLAPENEIPVVKAAAPPPAASAPAIPAATPSGAAVKSAFDLKSEAPAAAFGSGAASAPAPAREAQPAPEPAKPAVASAHSAEAQTPAPSFTFGGANAPEESTGSGKKILLGVAAVVVVAAIVYAGWSHIAGQPRQAVPTASAPATQPAKPASASATKPVEPAPSPAAQPAAETSAQPVDTTPAQPAASDEHSAASDQPAPADITLTTKPSASTSSRASASAPTKRSAAPAEPAAQPAPSAPALIVKGGTAPAQPKPAASDDAAPSMIGMSAPSSAGLPNLVGNVSAPKPVLQKLTISQGVSQGLLIKKISPVYPKTALAMRIEGTVDLMATVSKSGEISSVKVLKGDPQLARAAMDAVKEWKYKPYLLNGEPVEIQTQVTVTFKLPN